MNYNIKTIQMRHNVEELDMAMKQEKIQIKLISRRPWDVASFSTE